MNGPRWRSVGGALALGLSFPACIAGGYYLGAWGDRTLRTAPVLSYAGAALGTAAAFWNLARTVRRMDREDDESGR